MTKSVAIRFCEVEEVRRLPDTWKAADFRRLLEVLDIEDFDTLPEGDLEDMAVMALQDLDMDEAALVILTNFTDGRFTPGQIRNLSNELAEDRCWEEYADLAHQRALYVCVDVLSAAFPLDYSKPDATRVTLTITAPGLEKALANHTLGPDALLRAVGKCLEKDNILNRFFADQIGGAPFPEAASVVWHINEGFENPETLRVTFCGSSYWFEDVEDEWEAASELKWPDA